MLNLSGSDCSKWELRALGGAARARPQPLRVRLCVLQPPPPARACVGTGGAAFPPFSPAPAGERRLPEPSAPRSRRCQPGLAGCHLRYPASQPVSRGIAWGTPRFVSPGGANPAGRGWFEAVAERGGSARRRELVSRQNKAEIRREREEEPARPPLGLQEPRGQRALLEPPPRGKPRGE